MLIKIDLTALTQAVRQMGATPQPVVLDTLPLSPHGGVKINPSKGRQVELKDVKSRGPGLLSIDDQHVVLYIPDQGHRMDAVLQDPTLGKKFHLADCQTLQQMRQQNRYERYIARNGLSPLFAVDGTNDQGKQIKAEVELAVCQHCLRKLNYQGFQHRNRTDRKAIVGDFSLEVFFARYASFFARMPHEMADRLETLDRIAEHHQRRQQRCQAANWTCTQCGVVLLEHKHLLHLHHRNDNHEDHRRDNLAVLCADCQSKTFSRHPIWLSHENRQLIQRLRREQGLYRPPARTSVRHDDWNDAFTNADPAVHDLLSLIRRLGEPVPEVGIDIPDPDGIIVATVELAWPARKRAVVIDDIDDCETLRRLGWTVKTVAEELETYSR